jgi:hypothetical protein
VINSVPSNDRSFITHLIASDQKQISTRSQYRGNGSMIGDFNRNEVIHTQGDFAIALVISKCLS